MNFFVNYAELNWDKKYLVILLFHQLLNTYLEKSENLDGFGRFCRLPLKEIGLGKLMNSNHSIGTSVGIAVSRHSGGQLATMLVNRYFHLSFLFFFFSPSQTFFIERLLK